MAESRAKRRAAAAAAGNDDFAPKRTSQHVKKPKKAKQAPVAKKAAGRKLQDAQTPAKHRKPKDPGKQGAKTTRRPKNASRPKPRKDSLCPVSHLCGACQLIDVDYQRQLADKQQAMAELFEDLAREDTAMLPILGMQDPFHYRNKVISPYAPGKKVKPARQGKGKHAGAQHEILCGMYAQGTHHIIDTSCCLLENETAKRAIQAIRTLMPRFGLEPYDEDRGTGFIRHAVVRVGHTSGEVLLTIVTNGKEFPSSKAFCRALTKLVPEITTVVQSVNTRDTNVILGKEGEHTLYGPGFILDDLCGLRFRVSSHSFYQVNATQTEVLYRSAISLAKLTGTETVMDAYCGTGTIGLVAAKGLQPGKGAAKVIGVDEVAQAIKDAKNNAQHNGIENAQFFAEDAGAFMHRLADEGGNLDVLLMDPPRAGSTPEFLKATCTLAPRRIVYISCGPATQARDVAYLVKHGYHITDIQPVDMFPHTNHVENIVALERD